MVQSASTVSRGGQNGARAQAQTPVVSTARLSDAELCAVEAIRTIIAQGGWGEVKVTIHAGEIDVASIETVKFRGGRKVAQR